MHTPCGHTNHFWVSVSKAIQNYMKGCEWQVWLRTIESKADAKLKDINKRIKHAIATDNIKAIKTRLWKVQK